MTAEKEFIYKYFGASFSRCSLNANELADILEQYANEQKRKEAKKKDTFWFDIFNEMYPDEVEKILDSDAYRNYTTNL